MLMFEVRGNRGRKLPRKCRENKLLHGGDRSQTAHLQELPRGGRKRGKLRPHTLGCNNCKTNLQEDRRLPGSTVGEQIGHVFTDCATRSLCRRVGSFQGDDLQLLMSQRRATASPTTPAPATITSTLSTMRRSVLIRRGAARRRSGKRDVARSVGIGEYAAQIQRCLKSSGVKECRPSSL